MLAIFGALLATFAFGYWLGWDARASRAHLEAEEAWWRHYREMEAERNRMRNGLFDDDGEGST